jgi:hypothetical protein
MAVSAETIQAKRVDKKRPKQRERFMQTPLPFWNEHYRNDRSMRCDSGSNVPAAVGWCGAKRCELWARARRAPGSAYAIPEYRCGNTRPAQMFTVAACEAGTVAFRVSFYHFPRAACCRMQCQGVD